MKKMTTKGKHLTLDDRNFIEDALNDNFSLIAIANYLEKDPTTISKEIRRNKVASGKIKSTGCLPCSNRSGCTHTNICSNSCNKLCKKCSLNNCYRICPHYKAKSCSRLTRFPHVCNGCPQSTGCRLQKYKYQAKVAQTIYEECLVKSRDGIALSKKELSELDALISPLVFKGQPIAHIYASHREEIKCSKRTLYSYFEKNLFKARNVDLPRKTKYKPRKKKETSNKTSIHRLNRSYKDFLEFVNKHPEKHVVEMDIEHGDKGRKT